MEKHLKKRKERRELPPKKAGVCKYGDVGRWDMIAIWKEKLAENDDDMLTAALSAACQNIKLKIQHKEITFFIISKDTYSTMPVVVLENG